MPLLFPFRFTSPAPKSVAVTLNRSGSVFSASANSGSASRNWQGRGAQANNKLIKDVYADARASNISSVNCCARVIEAGYWFARFNTFDGVGRQDFGQRRGGGGICNRLPKYWVYLLLMNLTDVYISGKGGGSCNSILINMLIQTWDGINYCNGINGTISWMNTGFGRWKRKRIRLLVCFLQFWIHVLTGN